MHVLIIMPQIRCNLVCMQRVIHLLFNMFHDYVLTQLDNDYVAQQA
jgi:hypothetical protein